MFYKKLSTQEEAQGAFIKSAGVFLAVPKFGASLFLIFLCNFFDFTGCLLYRPLWGLTSCR